jgi:hypothetical protein
MAAGQADHASVRVAKQTCNGEGWMESAEAVAISQAFRLGQFWHAHKHAANW